MDADSKAPDTELVGEHRPWLTNLILLAAVAGLGLWAVFGEGQVKSTPELERHKKKVVRFFKPLDVVRIELRQGKKGAERLVLTRDASIDAKNVDAEGNPTIRWPRGWEVKVPVEDGGDDAQVMRLLNAVQHEEYSARIEGEDLAKYDFGEVKAQAYFSFKNGTTVALALGAKRARVYPVRLVGKTAPQAVFHVKPEFAEQLLQNLNNFRNKQLFTLPKGHVRGVSLTRGAEELRLRFKDPHWRIGAASDAGDGDFADRTKASHLAENVRILRAFKVHLDAPGPGQLETLGLKAPALSLSVSDREGKTQVLDIGGEVKDEFPAGQIGRYARLRDRPKVVYQLDVTFLGELLQAGPQGEWLRHHARGYASDRLFPIAGEAEQVVRGFGARFADGPEFRVRNKDGTWVFEEEGVVLADAGAVAERIKELLALKVSQRLDAKTDDAELGLKEPLLRLELVEGTFRYEVHVGRKGEIGTLTARHLLTKVPCRVAGLAEAVQSLRKAHLELLDKAILKLYAGDCEELTLHDRAGKLVFKADKRNPNPAVPRTPHQWHVDQPKTPDAPPDQVKAFIKSAFERVNVLRYETRAKGADLKEYGLDTPRKLTLQVNTFDKGGGAPVRTPKVLLLGDRVDANKYVYAMVEGGIAIGVIDAGFLDRIAAGFGKRHTLFGVEKWQARAIKVERAGKVVLHLKKPGFNWLNVLGGRRWVIAEPAPIDGDNEGFLEAFEQVTVAGPERATQQRLAETGLSAPSWRISLTTSPEAGGKETTRVLLLGKRLGERHLWATTPGGKQLGRFYDEPLRAIEAFLKEHPAPGKPEKKEKKKKKNKQ